MTAAHEKLLQGFALQQSGRLAEAEALYQQVLALEPNHFDALQLSGVIAAQTGDAARAAALLKRAVSVDPANPGAHYNLGYALEDLKDYTGAIASYDNAIRLQPGHVLAHNNRGIALGALKQYAAAVDSYERAIALAPNFAEAHHNRGVALAALDRRGEALAAFTRAVQLKPDYAEAFHSRALVNRALRHLQAARKDCDTALALRPSFAEAHNTLGAIDSDQHHPAAALTHYTQALALKPDYAEAHNNKGLALAALGEGAAALASFDTAIALSPDDAEAYHNRATTLNAFGRLEEALRDIDRARALNPAYDYLAGTRLFTKMRICDWHNFNSDVADISARILRGEKASPPFPIAAFVESPAVQRRAAEIWTQEECPADDSLGPIVRPLGAGKIKLGYFSMDFRFHPVSLLTAGLFETHDRAAFEVIAFSFGPDTRDDTRKRIVAAFDRFIDVRGKSDREIAALSRELEIDIAIDLAGHTIDARSGIFAHRAAPIQCSYLGYPATMGAPYIDYLIADETVIPASHRPHYSEKIVCLPSFQVNDRSRQISARMFTRAACGLPETGFVYCCFNNIFKFTPAVFDSWLRILTAVDGSSLFLFADTQAAMDNLRREAAQRGIDPARLVFGGRLGPADYAARFRVADLFLDTLPYNAGTTASDALWSGLPVLTRTGESFASRMAASLLKAIGMPELITSTAANYEALAIAIGGDPARLEALKAKLAAHRLTTPLFDVTQFTRHIETAYRRMTERHAAGLPPDHLFIV